MGDEELSSLGNQFTTSALSSCKFNLFSSSTVFFPCLIFLLQFLFSSFVSPTFKAYLFCILILIIIIPKVLINLIVLFLFLLALLLGTSLGTIWKLWFDSMLFAFAFARCSGY